MHPKNLVWKCWLFLESFKADLEYFGDYVTQWERDEGLCGFLPMDIVPKFVVKQLTLLYTMKVNLLVS